MTRMTAFRYDTRISLHHTDAAGVLFYSRLFELAHDAYERFLESAGFPLSELLDGRERLLLIVHAEADYHSPLRVADPVTIVVRPAGIGRHSFTLSYEFYTTGEKVAARVQTVHVAVDAASGRKAELPGPLRAGLEKYV